VVTAFSESAKSGSDTLVWCPAERVFVSPQRFELFDIQGRRVDGPAQYDMTRYPTQVSKELTVFIDVRHPVLPETRSGVTISGDVGDRYTRARAGERVGFCHNPVK